ncbi:MAG: hypothetical protein Q8K59_07155 [Nitrosomonas sp.]|nr:hypothetical protein [Nitrosomonas sp.]MDP1950854.1 hypothetical protein [Nitrosomonas sp.]
MRNDLIPVRLQAIWLQIRWQVARLGTIGKIGVGLLAVAIVFFLAAVLPQDATIQALKERAEIMRVQSPSYQASGPGKKMGDDQALQKFYEFFPRIDSSPFWIRELVLVAKKQGVEINSSDYRLVHEKGGRLTRYEMTLPIRGRYSQVRAFIADALLAVPAMAITGIMIKREDVRTEQLEVRLDIVLYLDE